MYRGVYSNPEGNHSNRKSRETACRDETLFQLISSIRELASSFCSNSEEVRKEVTSMSGTSKRDPSTFYSSSVWAIYDPPSWSVRNVRTRTVRVKVLFFVLPIGRVHHRTVRHCLGCSDCSTEFRNLGVRTVR